jgi:ATP-dependent RNA helicase DDX24/MAK5
MQNQFVELKKQKQAQMQIGGDIKRRKLVVINQNCIEPLQALRAGGNEMLKMKGQSAEKRRDIASLKKKRKEEKIGIYLYKSDLIDNLLSLMCPSLNRCL